MSGLTGKPLAWHDKDLASLLEDRFARHADAPGFLVRGERGFAPWTWGEVGARSREFAAGLVAMGLRPGARVAIMADTRPEWALADYGTLLAGCVTVTVYPTLPAAQVLHLVEDSGAEALVVDTDAQAAKAREVHARAKGLRHVVAFDAKGEGLAAFDEVRARGRALLAREPDALAARREAIRPGDVCTIIYTSGTTGIPKGAVLTHENWVATSRMMAEAFELEKYGQPRTTVAFLPLAHVLSRLVSIVFADLGGTMAFSSPRTLAEDLRAIQPRAIVCVPRIWERIHEQIHKTVAQMPRRRQRVFAAAERVAREYGQAVSMGARPPARLALQHALFEALVYRKLRARIGFSNLEGALSTSAAIRPELLYFFRGIGAPVCELWGLTELTGPATTTTLDRFKPGTVGWACPGVRVKLAADGEILVSGPNVFLGYHNAPAETAEVFVHEDGLRWFRTGDVGAIDEDGALSIVDRKKEIEVLSTGKKIAPVSVEERLKSASPLIAEALLVATGRKFAGALVQPDFDRLLAWARREGIAFDETAVVVTPDVTGAPMTCAVGDDLLRDPRVKALFEREIERANAECADFERVRAFHLVPHAFTVEREELTPTLKKKRRVIAGRYQSEITTMFGGG